MQPTTATPTQPATEATTKKYFDDSGYNTTNAELLAESITKISANMAYYNEVLALVNEIRAEAGVQPLTLDTTLYQAATMRAVEMNYSGVYQMDAPTGQYLTHT